MKTLALIFRRIRSFVGFTVAFLVCLEILLRFVSYEKGGDLYLFSNFPIGIPPTESEWDKRFAELAETEKNKTHYSRYDSILGWSYRTNSFSKDSLYYFDEYGMRNVFSRPHNCASDSCLHILLSGNSYTISYEVPAEHSIAYYLDSVLNSRGVACQIKIGATANYSVDQSYLEWKYRSRTFEPDLVMLGYNPMHAFGNTTIFHYFSFPETRIFYTKPCAVFEKSDSMSWLNFPTMKINEVKENIVLNFESSPFYEVEHAREAPRVKSFNFELSYVYAIYRRIFNYRPIIPSQIEVDKTRVLTEKIISRFNKELKQEGSKLMLFEIPIFEDLLKQTAGIRSDDKIWRFQGVETIPVRDSLLSELGLQKAYVSSLTHFSKHSNRLIAIKLANAIAD